MITLSYSATTINIESPDFPEQIKEDLVQTRARAMGGRVVSVTRTNSTLKNPTLVWNNLNDTDFTSLKTSSSTPLMEPHSSSALPIGIALHTMHGIWAA